jgi:sulfur carrier protein
MEILINNNQITVPESASLALAISSLVNIETKGIAVAINENIVPKKEWDSRRLTNGDKVLIIKATQGG